MKWCPVMSKSKCDVNGLHWNKTTSCFVTWMDMVIYVYTIHSSPYSNSVTETKWCNALKIKNDFFFEENWAKLLNNVERKKHGRFWFGFTIKWNHTSRHLIHNILGFVSTVCVELTERLLRYYTIERRNQLDSFLNILILPSAVVLTRFRYITVNLFCLVAKQ